MTMIARPHALELRREHQQDHDQREAEGDEEAVVGLADGLGLGHRDDRRALGQERRGDRLRLGLGIAEREAVERGA